ncbi:hypothetical protein R1sor_018447 [Riccia sorocarpa]|uniref:Uncharacterized protein n=1 Tax=Riccia sorocarpa TaxID=122646 RepID=A0ABD3I9P5_9MARC
MEYSEEKLNMGKSHAKQQTIWGSFTSSLQGKMNQINQISVVYELMVVDPKDREVEECNGEIADPNATEDLWDLASSRQPGVDDGLDDLVVEGQEAKHVMSEVLQQVYSEEKVK